MGIPWQAKTLNQEKYRGQLPFRRHNYRSCSISFHRQRSCFSKSSLELKGLCRSLGSPILPIPTNFPDFHLAWHKILP